MRQGLKQALALLAVLAIAAFPQAAVAHSGVPVTSQAPAMQCAALSASTPATWYATDNDGTVNTDTVVQDYPRGTSVIAPGFQYDCAPANVEIVIIVYNQAYGSEPALVDKRTLPAAETPGVFYYTLTTPDGSALQEGLWRVAFYEGKTVLSSGEILVGGAASLDTATQAVIQGTVTDLRTGQPVWQARIFVLQPGVSVEQFARGTQREDIFAQTRTDAQGHFSLWKPLERNVQYAMLIAADGYKLRGTNRLIIGDQATSPVHLDIKLVKR